MTSVAIVLRANTVSVVTVVFNLFIYITSGGFVIVTMTMVTIVTTLSLGQMGAVCRPCPANNNALKGLYYVWWGPLLPFKTGAASTLTTLLCKLLAIFITL